MAVPDALPAAPLQRLLENRRQAEHRTWAELAAALGVSSRTLLRVMSAETLSEQVADRIATRLGVHPSLVWPDVWEATSLDHKPKGDIVAKPGSSRNQAFQLRLPKEEYQALRMAAFVLDKSINTLVQDAIRDFLRDEDRIADLEIRLQSAGKEYRAVLDRLSN